MEEAYLGGFPYHDMGYGGQEALHPPIVAGLLAEAIPLARPQNAG